MAVRLEIGASIFHCETADEAVRIHRLIGASTGVGPITQVTAASAITKPPIKDSNGQAASLIQKLSPLAGKSLSSDELAEIVGASDKSGLGPKMRALRSTLLQENVLLDDLLVKIKPDAATPTTWLVKAVAHQ